MTPLISVKIPTYNCAEYLIQTINSILNQKDFDLDLLEIEVIDDCSTLDNPKAVVEKFGQGRVSFYRQPANVGAVKNFNTCIERSNNKYLHILHGDDYLEASFYSEMYKMIATRQANIYSTRCYVVDVNSMIIADSNVLNHTNKDSFIYQTPIQFVSVIFNTNCAKDLGGFDESLIHLNDRDMWLRLSLDLKWVHLNKVLSNYRVFEGNDTSKLVKSGLNILDYHRFYIKHSENLNITISQIKSILFNIYIKQASTLSGIDLLSNRQIIKSLLGSSYIYFLFRHRIKSLLKK
jgi:glycosyltransferase involved in cell wall biosynthesis